MKKYVKPELFFESYELSQNIAACGWDMTGLNDPRTCQAKGDAAFGNPEVLVFTNNEICDTILENYCYENSADNVSIRVFNS